MLKQNAPVPKDIKLFNQNNETVSLADYQGKYVVLYFYPKDNTPGCTKEACEFRDFNVDIQKLGVSVIGVSKDSVLSHQKFAAKHNLNFTLLADPEGELISQFGVRGLLGAKRTTFIINPEGKIVQIWEKVNALGHAREVYQYLKDTLKLA